MQRRRPVMLVVLDGWGWREERADNAVRQAKTPTFDRLWQTGPHGFLRTSGKDVGLPDGQMGNSEVGHLNIGAGRVVMQDLPRIDQAIKNHEIEKAPALLDLIKKLKASGGTCHLVGLVSPGGVHSHQNQAAALAKILADAGVPTRVHAITDGRDTPPQSAGDDIKRLLSALPKSASIATVCGRYFAMDRDKRWDRVEKAYNAMVEADGPRFADAPAVVADAYANKKFDEFIVPAVVGDYRGMRDGDGVLCFNFRADRVREILSAMLDPDFAGFTRKRVVRFAAAVGMAQYSAELDKLMGTIFPPQTLEHILGEVVADAGRKQLRMAETEKYAHVTYFLNGGREAPYDGEDRILVPSPKVATYDLQPEMSAPELTDKAVGAISSGKYDLIVLNYANPDMVGHTGSLPAAIKAVETVDTGLGRIADAIQQSGGALLVTADHGNCEMMRDPQTGGPHTAHTTNPVPVMLLGARNRALVGEGRLADVAPTLLELMELPKPKEMTGTSLLRAMPGKGDFGLSESHRTIPGGERVLIRRARSEDAALYSDFLRDVSGEDLRRRFFGRIAELSAAEIDKLTHLDYSHEMAFIALDEDTGDMLGLVRLVDELDEKTAQFAILVRSRLKSHGLGWLLMRRVIDYAKEKGLCRVYGDVLAENTTMLQMCAELGFHEQDIGAHIRRVVLDLDNASSR